MRIHIKWEALGLAYKARFYSNLWKKKTEGEGDPVSPNSSHTIRILFWAGTGL